jgi:hypothetical protein
LGLARLCRDAGGADGRGRHRGAWGSRRRRDAGSGSEYDDWPAPQSGCNAGPRPASREQRRGSANAPAAWPGRTWPGCFPDTNSGDRAIHRAIAEPPRGSVCHRQHRPPIVAIDVDHSAPVDRLGAELDAGGLGPSTVTSRRKCNPVEEAGECYPRRRL